MGALEEFFKSRYAPHYGCYYLYKVSEVLKNNGKPKISEIINLNED